MLSDPSTKTIETPPVAIPQISTPSTPIASPSKTSSERQLEAEPDVLPSTSKPTSQTILTSTEEEKMSERGEGRGTAEAEGEEAVKKVGVEAGGSDGDRTKESKVLVKRMVGDAEESNRNGSGGEESAGSEETEVLSEERTEIVRSEEEKDVGEESNKEEEVDQRLRIKRKKWNKKLRDDPDQAEQEEEAEAEEERVMKERKREADCTANAEESETGFPKCVIQEPIQVPYEAAKDEMTAEEEATDEEEAARMECRAKKTPNHTTRKSSSRWKTIYYSGWKNSRT